MRDAFEDSHGRLVRKRYFAYPLPEEAKPFTLTGIKTMIATETITSLKHSHQVTVQWRYYVTSHEADNLNLSRYVREHWL